MEPREHVDAIRRESAALAAAARRDLAAAVPSCPGWTVADLVVHLGVTQRWATETMGSGATERVRGAKERYGIDPADPAVVDWFEQGAAELAEVAAAVDPAAPAFTWGPEPHTARFWPRRMAHETAVHRWDAEHATGEPAPVEGDLAADGVDEVLTVFLPLRRGGSAHPAAGETYHLHRTDGDGEWLVRFEAGGHGVSVERAHAKGDAALRGPASDLLLFLWQRVPAGRLEVFGDAALVERWYSLAPV